MPIADIAKVPEVFPAQSLQNGPPLAWAERCAVQELFESFGQLRVNVDVLGQYNYLEVWNHDRFLNKLQRDPYTDDDARALSEFGI